MGDVARHIYYNGHFGQSTRIKIIIMLTYEAGSCMHQTCKLQPEGFRCKEILHHHFMLLSEISHSIRQYFGMNHLQWVSSL